jgi:nitrite reductase/ring-hydroxylating ferredoxin subunit
MMKRSIAILLLGAPAAVYGFVPASHPPRQQRQALVCAVKRGKGLDVGGEGGGGDNNNSRLGKPKSIIRGSEPGGGSANKKESGGNKGNWIQTTIPSIKSLPRERDVVRVVETGVSALVDRGTNPNGAVSIVNRGGETYCFSSSCASCKIPLTKARVLGPNDETGGGDGGDARIQCDFCGATYNLRTGAPVREEGGKILGFLFGGSKGASLPVYGLGERGGKVFINLP